MSKYKIGLVVGRFQPFHLGHLYLLREVLKHADKIIIAVGSSNIEDANNPLSYNKRLEMLEKVIEHEKIQNRILKIVPSPDNPDDDIWLKDLLKNTGKFDIEVGNNDWTNDILEKAGYKVLRVPYFKRELYQGVLIRKLFQENGDWQSRVPDYLVNFTEKAFENNSR